MAKQFVLLASMRTGSNLLNSRLNQFPGVVCHGEAFNPAFVGLAQEYLDKFGLRREDTAVRDSDPEAFLDRITSLDVEVVGLHMFPGHGRAVLKRLLDDANVKKICLRRSVFHSFVSLQVARKTDVWRVTRNGQPPALALADRQVIFRPAEFEEYRCKVDNFWKAVFQKLSRTGQSHFAIWYRETTNIAKLNQLAEFLGVSSRMQRFAETLAKQNPEPLRELVANFEEMVEYARSVSLEHQI